MVELSLTAHHLGQQLEQSPAGCELPLWSSPVPLYWRSSYSFGLTTDQGDSTIQQILHRHCHKLRAALRGL